MVLEKHLSISHLPVLDFKGHVRSLGRTGLLHFSRNNNNRERI